VSSGARHNPSNGRSDPPQHAPRMVISGQDRWSGMTSPAPGRHGVWRDSQLGSPLRGHPCATLDAWD
jgi:hypothetical protein